MFATFGYDPCSGKVIGSIEDNGYSYGQILEQTPMEQISKPRGILISLTPNLRDQGYGAYVHEVRSKDGNSGYLSYVTIHQGPEGTEVGRFELVKDKNGHYSNALYGCDELDDMSWFKRKPEYGGKGGWDRWGTPNPTFDVNTAWNQCNPEPEQPAQFEVMTADAPVQTSGDGEEIVVEGCDSGGNQGYREHQNAKRDAAPVTITKTRMIAQPKETNFRGGNQGFRARLPDPRGGKEGYTAYEKRKADAEAATFFSVKLVDTLTQTVIPYETGAPQFVPQPVEIAPGIEGQGNIRGGDQNFRGQVEPNNGQEEWQERVSQGRLSPGQLEWQDHVVQGRPGTEIVIDSRPAKREVEKRELSKEEIKAMQDRDFLRRPQADERQFKPNVQAGKVQVKEMIKGGVQTPERPGKIKRSEFKGLKNAMDAMAHGVAHGVDHGNAPDAMRKVEAQPTPVAPIEVMQKMQGVQAWQWAKEKRDAWNPHKLRQNKLTARAMTPGEGPKETGVRRYHTTVW